MISFSLAPESATVPACTPPWPGSRTMRRIGSGSTVRARRRGAVSGISGGATRAGMGAASARAGPGL